MLELGGKNPLVVCDDADLDNAVKWVVLSALSNAGQRWASGSRVIIFEAIYDAFCHKLVEATKLLKVGFADVDDLGSVINERQLTRMQEAIERARASGARVLIGGHQLTDREYAGGFYMARRSSTTSHRTTISPRWSFSGQSLVFTGWGTSKRRSRFRTPPDGLTAAIHTWDVNRAIQFTQKVQAGMAMVNAGTYGSEPHTPFGGVKQSGNGTPANPAPKRSTCTQNSRRSTSLSIRRRCSLTVVGSAMQRPIRTSTGS